MEMTVAGRWFGITDEAVRAFGAEVLGVDTITAPKPPLKSERLVPQPIAAAVKSHMEEYAELAAAVGVKIPDLGIEGFKAFLEAHGITVFSLAEVVRYMDKKAAEESKEKSGWEWRPLRAKDNRRDVVFGTPAKSVYNGRGNDITAGSDFYKGPVVETHGRGNGEVFHTESHASSPPYNRPVPLHALRKIALIEKEYAGDAAFFVSDYALAPQVQYPDPFLMVVVPNIDVKMGVGRFVIDFWDEPGFGLPQQLA